MTMLHEASAHAKARIAGGLWWAVIIAGSYGAFATGGLYVPNDPAATAARILGAESQVRLAFVANVVSWACYIGVTVIMRDVLNPVGRTLASLSAFFGITGIAAGMAISIAQLVPLLLLKATYPTGFTPDQLRSLAFTALGVNRLGFLLSLVFFGLQVVTLGYLIARSTFLPRILGVLLALGGSSYVIGAFMTFVSPAAGARLSPIVLAAAFVGEGSLGLWLLLKGVNVRNWEEQSARSPSTRRVTA